MEVTTTPAPAATHDVTPWPFPRRFVALFTSPKGLFEHLEERPTWLVPLLVTLVLVAVYVTVLWNPVILPNMLTRFEEKDTPQNVVDMMTKNGLLFSLIPGILFGAGFTFLTALVVQGIGGFLLGGKLSYRQALSIVSHVGLVSLPAFAIMIPLALVSKTAQVSVGPGMLFNAETAEGFFARFIALFLASIDVFKIWQVALTALGVSVIGRVPRSKATVAMFVAYFVASLLGACMGAIMPR
jgi:hypothetical protein